MTLTNEQCAELGINPEYVGSDFDDFHKEQMENPEFRHEYDKLQLQRKVARLIFEKRTNKQLSQQELAKRANTKQAVISRIEKGNVSVGLELLQRIADALGSKVDVSFQ